jgi:enoyl-CoA hydratase/carnithine racemase
MKECDEEVPGIDDATMGALSGALELERVGQQIPSATTDFSEGVAAFQQKRPQQFIGG